MERTKDENIDARQDQKHQDAKEHRRSGAFNEKDISQQKSTRNIEEDAGLEQERKDAKSERD